MPSEISFAGPGGVDAGTHILNIASAARPTVAEVLLAGQKQKTRIVTRTARGVDAFGNPFIPYSRKYAKRKAKAGHSSTVNLFGTQNHPHMMNRIQVLAGGSANQPSDLLQLAFQGEEAVRAKVHNEGGSVRKRTGKKNRGGGSFPMPKRHFWDASAQDVRDMITDIGNAIIARLKALP